MCIFFQKLHTVWVLSSGESTQQLLGIVNDLLWKEYRNYYDGIMGNEILRRITLSFVALHSTPVICPNKAGTRQLLST